MMMSASRTEWACWEPGFLARERALCNKNGTQIGAVYILHEVHVCLMVVHIYAP